MEKYRAFTSDLLLRENELTNESLATEPQVLQPIDEEFQTPEPVVIPKFSGETWFS